MQITTDNYTKNSFCTPFKYKTSGSNSLIHRLLNVLLSTEMNLFADDFFYKIEQKDNCFR